MMRHDGGPDDGVPAQYDGSRHGRRTETPPNRRAGRTVPRIAAPRPARGRPWMRHLDGRVEEEGGRGLPPAGLYLPGFTYRALPAGPSFAHAPPSPDSIPPPPSVPPTPRDRVRHQGRPSGPVLGPDRTGICTTRIRPARRTPACPPLSKPLLTSTSRMRACAAGGRTAAALRRQNRTVLSRGLSPARRPVLISERPS